MRGFPVNGPGPLRPWQSLRARGLVATLALLAYLLGSAAYVAHERGQIDHSFQALQLLSRHEKALALIEAAVSGALVDVNEASNAGEGADTAPAELRLYMENCQRLFAALDEFDPGYVLLQRAIVRSYDALAAQPVRANWIDLRESMRRAVDDFDIRARRLANEREALTLAYHRQTDAVTVESLLLELAGIVAFGSLAAWFFARLAHDVRTLESHARQIVRGQRGVALPVRRADEIGHLMHAVNRMAVDLDEREKQIELDGQRRSHQDKMLAVGALAAGVAHEVNNPLAVIAGVAEELKHADPADREGLAQQAQLIQAQAQRAAQVARQLAEVAAPQPAELDWLDLNALVRRVVQLMGYDRRWRGWAFGFDADASLPALRSSGNALQQLLMQLLTLVCDAIAARPGTPREVAIATSHGPGRAEVRLRVPAVLDFTQPAVRRGLLLCRAIVEPLGGGLAFDTPPDDRLQVRLWLPLSEQEGS